MTTFRIASALVIVTVLWSTPCLADLVITFYARPTLYHPEGYTRTGPHAFARIDGQHNGKDVHLYIGFGPRERNSRAENFLAYGIKVFTGIDGHFDTEAQKKLTHEYPYLATPITDTQFDAIMAEAERWSAPTSVYRAFVRNCVMFTDRVAHLAGLTTPTDVGKSAPTYTFPENYMRRLAQLNPGRVFTPSGHQASDIDATLDQAFRADRPHYTELLARSQSEYQHQTDSGFPGFYLSTMAKRKEEAEAVEKQRVQQLADDRARNYDLAKQQRASEAELQRQAEEQANKIRHQTGWVEVTYDPVSGVTVKTGSSAPSRGDSTPGSPAHPASPGTTSPPPRGPAPSSSCPVTFCSDLPVEPPPDGTPLPLPLVAAAPAQGNTSEDDASPFGLSLRGTSTVNRSARVVLDLGALRPGNPYAFELWIESFEQEGGSYVSFEASEPLKLMTPPNGYYELVGAEPRSLPDNVITLRPHQSKKIDVSFNVPELEADGQPRVGQEIPRIYVYKDGIVVNEMYLMYRLAPDDVFAMKIESGDLLSGYGKQWSPDYRICTGPPPYGYEFSGEPLGTLGSVRGTHDRSCGSGYSKCKLTRDAERGACLEFSAQGHEGNKCLFCDEQGKYTLVVSADLLVTFRRVPSEPRWSDRLPEASKPK